MKKSQAFKTVKIKAKSFVGAADLPRLEQLYMNLEAKKTDAVTAQRKALIASAKAASHKAEVGVAEAELLSEAAEFENRIGREYTWLTYRDAEGDLVFEGITERLMRNNFRAQQLMIGKQTQEDNGSHDAMFEDEDDE